MHQIPAKESFRNLLRSIKQCATGPQEVPWNIPGIDAAKLGARPIRFELAAGVKPRATVQALSIDQIEKTNLPMLLHWEDRNSMASSIEARVPFLDHPLVELAVGLRSNHKIAGGITKHVLRRSMQGVLPEPVRNRVDKMGFVTPAEVWVEKYSDQFRRSLRSAIERSGGIITEDAVRELDAVSAGKSAFSFQIFRMICFGVWLERFSVRTGSQ